MPVCQVCGTEITVKNASQFMEVRSGKLVLLQCKDPMQCELNRQFAKIAQFKYTGNCYLENFSGRDRIVVCEPGSMEDRECADRVRSSSRWTALGRFSDGKPMNWKQVYHVKVREEYFNILNGVYDLEELASTLESYQWSLRTELREAFLAFISVQED